MNRLVMWMLIFCISMNFATLIIPKFIPIFAIPQYTGSMPQYDENLSQAAFNFKNTSANPDTTLIDKGNFIYRVLDLLNIGLIQKFVDMIDTYLYAFPRLLRTMLSPMMTEEQSLVVFGTLYSFVSIIYGLSIFEWWTGRRVSE